MSNLLKDRKLDWEAIGFLKGIDDIIRKKEVTKWFDCALEFVNNPTVAEYDDEFSNVVFPMIRRIVCSKNGPTDDFSIENLYKEFMKGIPEDIALKIENNSMLGIDADVEKCAYIAKRFIKQL